MVDATHRPPGRYTGTPNVHTLPAGTTLWRIHSRDHQPTDFNTTTADVFGGGRFDSTPDHRYAFYYAGLAETTALAEKFLRGLPCDDRGYRRLQRKELRGRRISAVPTTKPLFLVGLLNGPDLAAVGQDSWLISAEGPEYARTRAVGHGIREQAGWAQGFIWPSLRDTSQPALVLFEDREAGDALAPDASRWIDLDDEKGEDWLRAVLASYRVTVSRRRAGTR
jgi:hypothetical protein